jgi:hypothetical protein
MRCHHGTYLCSSWQDCSQCWDEHRAEMDMEEARQEREKQTELLRQIEEHLRNQKKD